MKRNRILEKIAAEHGISVTEVRKEIQKAIDKGLKNHDPKVQNYWKQIPCKGDKPTPEEVIAFTSSEAKKKFFK